MAEPLTKKKKNSEVLYHRRQVVEDDINRASQESMQILLVRGRLGSDDADYLYPETIVHLVRKSLRAGQNNPPLLAILMVRCNHILKNQIAASIPGCSDLRQQILANLGIKFAKDRYSQNGEMDYFEVNFNHAFASLRKDDFDQHMRFVGNTVQYQEEDENLTVPIAGTATVTNPATWRAPEAEERIHARQMRRKLGHILKRMPKDDRKAYVVCELWDWSQKKAAEAFNVDDRTIRNRIARAKEKIESLKED